MEYTVQGLSQMAGVSTRTLRYYDQIEILKPARINESGYRIYGSKEVDRLQQILFYRELGMKLEHIKDVLDEPSFDELNALKNHLDKLLERKAQLNLLIENIDKTIAFKEGRFNMKDKEKFEGFKRNMINENEKKYGKEIREKYGNEAVDKSNMKLNNMIQEEYDELSRLEKEVLETLYKALNTGNPASEMAQKAADLHRQWLNFYWDKYTKEAHAGVVQMYVEDERFRMYYDKGQSGAAKFLRDSVLIYTGMGEK